MKKNARAISSAKRWCVLVLAGMASLPSFANLTSIGGNVFQNERGSSVQVGIGEVIMDALREGHPGCYKRLTNEYLLGAEKYPVSKSGLLSGDAGHRLRQDANEAFLCAMGISNLISSIRNSSMGIMGAGDARAALANLFRQQLGKQVKVAASNFSHFFDPHVSQEPGFQEPYYVVTGAIAPAGPQATIAGGVDAKGEITGMVAFQNTWGNGVKQGQDTMQFAYYAVGRVTGWKASINGYICNYDNGTLTILRGGRVYFSLAEDIVAGYKISISENGTMTFDAVK